MNTPRSCNAAEWPLQATGQPVLVYYIRELVRVSFAQVSRAKVLALNTPWRRHVVRYRVLKSWSFDAARRFTNEHYNVVETLSCRTVGKVLEVLCLFSVINHIFFGGSTRIYIASKWLVRFQKGCGTPVSAGGQMCRNNGLLLIVIG
jgi:hypothetical protein